MAIYLGPNELATGGGGGGNASIITNPNDLPKVIVWGATIKINTANIAYSRQNQATFYDNAFFATNGGNVGSRVVISGTGYNTICDLTGSGEFYSALSSRPDQFNNRTISWKFTVDGVETIINAEINVNLQMQIGMYLPTIAADDAYVVGYNNRNDRGSSGGYNNIGSNNFLTLPGNEIGLFRQDAFKNFNLTRLRFENSFKLEYSIDENTAGSYNRIVVAQYQLD